VDIPAVFYSLSFAPNPDFSQVYPPRAEILEYFNKVADKYDVSRHIVQNTEWEGAYWQDQTSSWLVRLKDLTTGQAFHHDCKILISAVGALVNPNGFGVPGVEDFEGDIVHTAAWDEDMSLHQKDVIVVGNGCELHLFPLYHKGMSPTVDQVRLLSSFPLLLKKLEASPNSFG
jgi:cation diffusion facilitator CzcD-associated flavoprotein CzcO